eukprot:CFRG6546T1
MVELTWTRKRKGDFFAKVDPKVVLSLLNERTKAKEEKDYDKSDEIAKELQGMNVCYSDDNKQWYVKKQLTPEPAINEESGYNKKGEAKGGKKQVRDSSAYAIKKKERNRRQAQKNRDNKKKLRKEKAAQITKITKFDDFKVSA